MPELLFKLRNVPADEAEDIRQLLSEHEIEFYETHAGGWGISMPGIWLPDASQLEQAKRLIDDYQQQRATAARAEWEEMRRQGTHPTLASKAMEHPLRFLLLAAAVLFILYLTLRPFFTIGG